MTWWRLPHGMRHGVGQGTGLDTRAQPVCAVLAGRQAQSSFSVTPLGSDPSALGSTSASAMWLQQFCRPPAEVPAA